MHVIHMKVEIYSGLYKATRTKRVVVPGLRNENAARALAPEIARRCRWNLIEVVRVVTVTNEFLLLG